jgi:ABC-type antimicrobial peptide transport system permease subunit
VRLQADSPQVVRGVEQTAAAAGLPVKFQDKLATVVDRGLWPYRAFASVSGALTSLALLLATVGLYGTVSFGVNQRTREIGVRMALGATTERVVGFFVRQGMRLVAWGVGLGLVGGSAFAVLLGKVMPGADFHGTPAFRCLVFAAVTLLLTIVALIACWLPARRAAKVDPMVALRAE